MVDIKEIQNLTYRDSRGIKRLRKIFDKKIKKAAKHGTTSAYIPLPLFFNDIGVFLSIAKEYENIGYKIEVNFELWTVNEGSTHIVSGVKISWEKSI